MADDDERVEQHIAHGAEVAARMAHRMKRAGFSCAVVLHYHDPLEDTSSIAWALAGEEYALAAACAEMLRIEGR